MQYRFLEYGMNNRPFRHHPDVLRIRALFTEGLYFQALTQKSFDDLFVAIDFTFVERDALKLERDVLLEFLKKRDLLGDYERELQHPELSDLE